MKLSHYIIAVNDYPSEGESVLFHSRTQAMVKIDRDMKQTLDRLPEISETTETLYREKFEHLRNMGFLVVDEAEDLSKIQDYFHQVKHGFDSSTLMVQIVTTDACNFQCVYCFEENAREKQEMRLATAVHTISWIKEQVEQLGYKRVYMVFYGGEPLLNRMVLEYMATTLQFWCRTKNVSFEFLLQTNGYLVTPELVDQYMALGLKHVQISLDGVKDEHDKRRPLRGGGGTFDRIMDNIVACVDKVKIGISVSYEKGETDHIQRLLDYLDERKILKKLGLFSFSPIHPALGGKADPQAIRHADCLCNFEDDAMIKANRAIHRMVTERGLPNKNGLAASLCPLTREYGSVTVDQNGCIFRCNALLGYPEFSEGDVFSGRDRSRKERFLNLDVWKKCPPDCVYLPICAGGCRLASFYRDKNFETPVCHKKFLDEMAPEYVKKEYNKFAFAKARKNNEIPK